jgi:hypothetical protein
MSIQTSTPSTILITRNGSIFDQIFHILNYTQYDHQMADLMEPEKYSAFGVHVMIWLLSIVTYILAIPVSVRMFRSRAYLNVIDYFSAHIILCAFIAWIPAFILILHQWFNVFTLRLCRLHYVLLSSNETVRVFSLSIEDRRCSCCCCCFRFRCSSFST